jgi:ribokinase
VLLTQLEIPLETCVAAAQRSRDAGGRVVVNTAPLPNAADPRLGELLRLADVLVANETEALALAGAKPDAPGAEGWPALASGLRRLGAPTAIVTLGAAGAVVADDSGAYSVPSVAVAAVDATGAGDAFCGALAAALDAQLPMRQAVQRACAAGALATTAVGAQEALPTGAQLDEFEGENR